MSMRGGEGLNWRAVVGWEGMGQSRHVLEQLDLGGVVGMPAVSLKSVPSFLPGNHPHPTFPCLSAVT